MSNGYARYARLSQDEDALEPQLELREQSRSEPKGIYFSNGDEPKRRIDYVLVYETTQDDGSDSSKERRLQDLRKTFEDNLRREKLLIEYDELALPQVRVRCNAWLVYFRHLKKLSLCKFNIVPDVVLRARERCGMNSSNLNFENRSNNSFWYKYHLKWISSHPLFPLAFKHINSA